ncbi:MAG TPA: SH3 domain-containing protein, partial [Phototrophicaceae bacterium]|nr:SH3 domain-containing protein [Phototrophicaceae bacterium]
MSYGTRPPTLSKRPSPSRGGGGGGLPAWLVFLMAVALVFGGYYLWLGAQSFLQTGGLGVVEATERAVIVGTATARFLPTRTTSNPFGLTLQPTASEIPPCQDFVVIVEQQAIVRNAPSVRGEVVRTLSQGDVVCVVGKEGETDWYIIDTNPLTRRLDAAYMR